MYQNRPNQPHQRQLHEDATKITRILKDCPYNVALKQIVRHQVLASPMRIRKVLSNILSNKRDVPCMDVLMDEAMLIKSIFPKDKVSLQMVLGMLKGVHPDTDRMKYVVRMLLEYDDHIAGKRQGLEPPGKPVAKKAKPTTVGVATSPIPSTSKNTETDHFFVDDDEPVLIQSRPQNDSQCSADSQATIIDHRDLEVICNEQPVELNNDKPKQPQMKHIASEANLQENDTFAGSASECSAEGVGDDRIDENEGDDHAKTAVKMEECAGAKRKYHMRSRPIKQPTPESVPIIRPSRNRRKLYCPTNDSSDEETQDYSNRYVPNVQFLRNPTFSGKQYGASTSKHQPRDFPSESNQTDFYYEEDYEANNNNDLEASDNNDDDDNNGHQPIVCETLLHHLMEVFPDASPDYVRQLCEGKYDEPGVLDELITGMLETEYPRRDRLVSPKPKAMTAEELLEHMKEIVPDADPDYLQEHAEMLHNRPDDFKRFMDVLVGERRYPSMKEYMRKKQLSSQQSQYTTNFSVEKFLEVIPDPDAYFKDTKRWGGFIDKDSLHYVTCLLRNRYNKITLVKIRQTLRQTNFNFFSTCIILDKVPNAKTKNYFRDPIAMPQPISNIPLLQEIAYVLHKNEIEEYVEQKRIAELKEFEDAKGSGCLHTCKCCYDEEVMSKNVQTCEEGCIFCKECVCKGVEVTFGEGKLEFACLGDCQSFFSLQTLQTVLPPKLFSTIALRKQLEEVKAAGIEDLETCPFCDFATIPAREDKLFRCLNPECMKESCRQCKETSHVPLRCEEVEKEEEVRTRTYIENKMTEALLRKCYKCGLKFIKEDGCNKMTCSCGAQMCYICLKPVTDYKHFNGQGGNRYHLCPLYSDTNKLHQDNVLESATKAKQEVGVQAGTSKLKHDPTADVRRHYQQQARNNNRYILMPYPDMQMDYQMGMNNFAHPHPHLYPHHYRVDYM